MVDRVHDKPQLVAPSRRYRLTPGQFKFKLVDGKLIEVNTGLPAVHSARSTVIGQQPRTGPDRPQDTIYLNNDGSPADPISQFVLGRGMNDYLSVVTCRVAPDVTQDHNPSNMGYWEGVLSREGLPEDIPLVSPGGNDTSALERIHADRFENLRHRRTRADAPGRKVRKRPIQAIPPAEWRRFVIKRLALFFHRFQRDPLVLRLAEYFCRTRHWNDWFYDQELEPLILQYDADDRLQRFLDILERYTFWRAGIAHGRELKRGAFRQNLRTPHGTFVFAFPHVRRGNAAKKQKADNLVLLRTTPYLIRGYWFRKTWLAAAVYFAQKYLEKPERLANRRLSQKEVADHFKITRRQLTHALKQLRVTGAKEKDYLPKPMRRPTD